MARLSLFCIFLVLVIVSIARIDAAARVARSPPFGGPFGPPPPPPPPPAFGPSGPRNFGPGNSGPGRDEQFGHRSHQNNRDSDYNVPPGGSISISKTISISSGGNAQSSAGSSAGSGGSSADSSSSASANSK